jgi:hypothetical protein
MDLRITVTVTTPTLPDAKQLANLIPPAFARMAGGNPADITVKSVSIEMIPVQFSAQNDFPNAIQPPAIVPPPPPTA